MVQKFAEQPRENLSVVPNIYCTTTVAAIFLEVGAKSLAERRASQPRQRPRFLIGLVLQS